MGVGSFYLIARRELVFPLSEDHYTVQLVDLGFGMEKWKLQQALKGLLIGAQQLLSFRIQDYVFQTSPR